MPQIRTFCQTSDCALALNTIAVMTDKVKDQIMCVDRKYNLMDQLDCVQEEVVIPRPGEKVFFQYMVLKIQQMM